MFGVTLAACVLAGARAHAQGVNVDQPTLGSSVDSDLLADLPLGSTIGSLLDTSIPEVISERVDAGTFVPGRALKNATPSQVALAWLLARSPVMLPIPETSKVVHLVENVAAAGVGLTEDEINTVNQILLLDP